MVELPIYSVVFPYFLELARIIVVKFLISVRNLDLVRNGDVTLLLFFGKLLPAFAVDSSIILRLE